MDYEYLLKNFLAIIHRDGGHHTGKVGTVQSIKDAQQVYYQLQEENERLNRLFERWEHMIDPETNPGGCANCFHQEWKHTLGEQK